MQELSAGLDFSLNDVKMEGKFDYDVEWAVEDGCHAASEYGQLTCPVSNLLYNSSQSTTMKLSTLVQYMRVMKRSHSLSKKVQLLISDAAELEGLPISGTLGPIDPVSSKKDFMCASSRQQDKTTVRTMGADIERLVATLFNEVGRMNALGASKVLVDITKRAIFGSNRAPEYSTLQRVVENVRFLRHEIQLYERVALNIAKIVIKEKAMEVFAADSKGRRTPDRQKSRSRSAGRSASPSKSDMAESLPTNFVDRSERRESTSTADDMIVLGSTGPATISLYQRGLTPSYAPGLISMQLDGTGDECNKALGSMNWKIDELMQVRKVSEDLTEERDKAVSLYKEAVEIRKRAQKDCKEAQLEYARMQSLIPTLFEGIQEVGVQVACAESEARSHWYQMALIERISVDMEQKVDRLFACWTKTAGEKELVARKHLEKMSQLSEELQELGKKLQKYRDLYEAARAEQSQLTSGLAQALENVRDSEQERRRAEEKNFKNLQTLTKECRSKVEFVRNESRLKVATLTSEHDALVADLKRAHSKFTASNQQEHEGQIARLKDAHAKFAADAQERYEHLENEREQQVRDWEALHARVVADLEARALDLEAQHMKQVSTLEARHVHEIEHLTAKFEQEIAVLNAKSAKETKEHNVFVLKLQAEHQKLTKQLKDEHSQQLRHVKTSLERDLNEMKMAWARDVANINQAHTTQIESNRIEHNRKVELIEREQCLGTRCCEQLAQLKRQLKVADSERNSLHLQVRDLEQKFHCQHVAAAASHPQQNHVHVQVVTSALATENLQEHKDEVNELIGLRETLRTTQNQLDEMRKKTLVLTREVARLTTPGLAAQKTLGLQADTAVELVHDTTTLGLRADKDSLANELQSLKEQLARSEEEVSNARLEQETLKAQTQSVRQQNAQRIKSLETEIARLNTATLKYGEQAHVSGRDLFKIKSELEGCISELEAAKKEAALGTEELARCILELEAAKKEVERRTEEIARYTSELEAANKPASEAEAANKPASHTQSCNLKSPATVEQLAQKPNVSLETRAPTEIEQKEGMCEYSVAQLAQVKAHDLLTELEQCKAESQQCQIQLDQCRTELEAAKKEAARRTEELARYTSELEAAKKEASEAEAANKPASHTQSCNLEAPATVEQLAPKNTISLHLTELEQCKAECQQCQIQLEQCRTESAQFTSNLAQCTTKCQQYETELEKARTDLQHYEFDLTRRLDSATKELEHVQAQLRLCQQARDQSHRALQLAEEKAEEQVGEYKHSAEIAREELRVAVHRLEDAVAAKERLQLQLDSEPDGVHSELENTNVLIEQMQEALRKKNLELHDLKNMNRKLESEMQLLCKDRAIITTQQVADRRALQNKYKVCEDNRRMLELQNIDLQALNSQYADRIKELTKQLLSNKWGKHADEMEQRRMHALHVELQAQTEAREDAERKAEEAERKVEQLRSVGCLDTNAKRPRHVLKEPLYRAQLLQKVEEKNLK
jgi:hypothetical protein